MENKARSEVNEDKIKFLSKEEFGRLSLIEQQKYENKIIDRYTDLGQKSANSEFIGKITSKENNELKDYHNYISELEKFPKKSEEQSEKLETKSKFSVNEVPFDDFEKLGISRESLEKTNNLEALLKGDKTQIYPITNFKNLEIEVKLKLEKNDDKTTQLVVYPERMERKLKLETMVSRLNQIQGVEDVTAYVKKKGFDKNSEIELRLVNKKSIENYYKSLKEYSNNPKTKIPDIKPDTWLKLDKKIADHYIKNMKIPVIKERSHYFLGMKLKNIDNHSFKQHENTLKQTSKEINKESIRSLKVSR